MLPKNDIAREAYEQSLFEDMASEIVSLRYKNTRDSLTGLLNEEAFNHEVDQAIEESREFGVLALDGTNFKYLNDTYGHEYGNEVIKRIGKYLRPDDKSSIVARGGGDEFFVLVYLDNPKEEKGKRMKPFLRLVRTANHLDLNMKEMIEKDSRLEKFDIAIGAALFNPATMDKRTLLDAADEGMRQSKARQHEEKGKYRP